MFSRLSLSLIGSGNFLTNFVTSCNNHSYAFVIYRLSGYVNYYHSCLITSAKDVMFSPLFVFLSVSNFAQKLPNGFALNFQGKLAIGQ